MERIARRMGLAKAKKGRRRCKRVKEVV